MKSNVLSSIVRRLEGQGWDFPNSNSNGTIHSIHPYPARFIPEIPATLIEELGVAPKTAVLDPFCGCGTTLVESQTRGHASIGIDLNPIACLMSRVKTTVLPRSFLEQAETCSKLFLQGPSQTGVDPSKIPNISHWFKPEIQEALGTLLAAISQVHSTQVRDALCLAVSSIIVRVSNQESDTRYAAIEKRVSRNDVVDLFMKSCHSMARVLPDTKKELPSAHVIEGDVLKIAASEIPSQVSLVITSPPYPNAYEYWLYHKYRMWWLGMDPLMVKKREIGARPHYFRKNPETIDNFLSQMTQVLAFLCSVVIPSGFVCFVVGDSKIHGKIYDNAELMKSAAKSLPLKTVSTVERRLLSTRKSFNLSHSRAKTEQLVVFQRSRS